MNKILWIARREFVATVCTKAFLFGLIFLPALLGLAFVVINVVQDDDYQASGRIAVVDPTGRVVVEARQLIDTARADAARLSAVLAQNGTPLPGGAISELLLASPPDFTLVQLPFDSSLEDEKPLLLRPQQAGGYLALVYVHADAIEAATAAAGFGSYDLYTGSDIDQREIGAIRSVLRDAIVNLRIEANGFDRATVERLMRVGSGQSITVTETDEREGSTAGLNVALPASFMFLLFLGIMGGGQHLMTSTIEEKSSRVVEVLLAAVSPIEIMAGKLLGAIAVSLVGLSVYLAAGLLALAQFDMLSLLDTWLIFYLFVFFFIAFFTIGSLMLAIGSAVNELREAQTLMMPVTILIMLPVFLWMPISRDPSSALSLTASFVPPINTFGMLLRMASTQPPPLWQVWLTILIGVAGVFVALWCASRVFRIGILLTGKPPDFRTLFRWIRAG
jgi:ABC-2 type transport system permease protein